jgi:hypothetical protein
MGDWRKRCVEELHSFLSSRSCFQLELGAEMVCTKYIFCDLVGSNGTYLLDLGLSWQ